MKKKKKAVLLTALVTSVYVLPRLRDAFVTLQEVGLSGIGYARISSMACKKNFRIGNIIRECSGDSDSSALSPCKCVRGLEGIE